MWYAEGIKHQRVVEFNFRLSKEHAKACCENTAQITSLKLLNDFSVDLGESTNEGNESINL